MEEKEELTAANHSDEIEAHQNAMEIEKTSIMNNFRVGQHTTSKAVNPSSRQRGICNRILTHMRNSLEKDKTYRCISTYLKQA